MLMTTQERAPQERAPQERAPQRTQRCGGAGETHFGARPVNQDVIIVDEKLGLFAVLDGMGGAAAGDIAAQMAADALVDFIAKNATSPLTPKLLELAIEHAAVVVHRAAERVQKWKGMGTTVVACLELDETHVVIGHAGDSRAYLLRDGHLQELTRDHTVARGWYEEGKFTAEEAAQSFLRNMLTRNLGDEHGVQADLLELELQAGDRILLCSDGLYGCVARDQLERVLMAGGNPQQSARALVEAAMASDTVSDNVSAVVLDAGLR